MLNHKSYQLNARIRFYFKRFCKEKQVNFSKVIKYFIFLSICNSISASEFLIEEKPFPTSSPHVLANKDTIDSLDIINEGDALVPHVSDNILEIEERETLKHILFNEEFIPYNICYSKINTVLKGTAVIFGATAGLPLIVLARSAVESNEVLGWVFASSTVLSIGASRTWGLFHLLPDVNTLASNIKMMDKKERAYHSIKHIMCHLTGLSSSLPFTYAIYKYNTIKILALSTLISEYGLGTYAYLELFNKGNVLETLRGCLRCNQSQEDVILAQSKSRLISSLNNVVPNILTLENFSRAELIRKLSEDISFQQNEEDFLNDVLAIHNRSDSKLHKYFKIITESLSCGIPLSNAFQSTILSLNSARAISTSDLFAAGYAFVTVTPGVVLGLISTVNTMDDIYNSLFCLKGRSFVRHYYPKMKFGIMALSFVTSIMTASGSMFLTYDTLMNSPLRDFSMYFTIMNGIGAAIFESYSMRHILENLLQFYAEKYGSDEERNLIKLEKLANKLTFSLSAMNKKTFSHVIANIQNQSLKTELHSNSQTENNSKKFSCRASCNIL